MHEVQYPCKIDGSISCQSLYMKVLLWTIFLDICSFDGPDAPIGEKTYWKLLHHPFIQPRIQGTQSREGV
ncbi:hypothetical protein MtrunA17_Chr7g0260491 [Medicago truncatula]|uniref:Uncharacterized protein n=1 Tax=Medicago truncatula TaxID=3880 RepID=A0A396H489_MEDTR|nr:hypothetical protein MtrunA17_Chr7g0260481 [Medicago truncatula]RHN48132.1 hypothetical protein MtrunA17_Chr7g0260491 [Medicago truncatula]